MMEANSYQVTKPRIFEQEYKVPNGLSKAVIYIMSLFLPFGFMAGMFYSTKPGKQSRLFGRNCLALSITPILLILTVGIITFLTMTVIFILKY